MASIGREPLAVAGARRAGRTRAGWSAVTVAAWAGPRNGPGPIPLAGAVTPGVMHFIEHDQIPRVASSSSVASRLCPLRVPARLLPFDALQRDVSFFTKILQRRS